MTNIDILEAQLKEMFPLFDGAVILISRGPISTAMLIGKRHTLLNLIHSAKIQHEDFRELDIIAEAAVPTS